MKLSGRIGHHRISKLRETVIKMWSNDEAFHDFLEKHNADINITIT